MCGLWIWIFVLFIGGNVFQAEPFLSWWKRFDAISIPQLPWILALLAFVFLVAPGAFKSSYGRELFLNARGCDINSQQAPDTIDRQPEATSDFNQSNWGRVVTLPQTADTRTTLRHGLYEHPQCADRIADWLKAELARRE